MKLFTGHLCTCYHTSQLSKTCTSEITWSPETRGCKAKTYHDGWRSWR